MFISSTNRLLSVTTMNILLRVSVHEGCYARRKNYDRNRDESTLFRCARCCQSDETRYHTV